MSLQSLEVVRPDDVAASVRLFIQMYGDRGSEPTGERVDDRLLGMISVGYQLTELRRDGLVIGFALWIDLYDYVFIRSFGIDIAHRSDGLGRQFFEKLTASVFPPRPQVRVDVLDAGPHGFWKKMGFQPMTTGLWRSNKGAA
ncbi:MAG: hypothetical protein AAGB15_00660 [Pseudomonadota bacterium]